MVGKYLRRLEMPKGVNLMLPLQARRKRVIENKLLSLFSSWGYTELVTPTFEFCDNLNPRRDRELDEMLYKFVDRTGKTLALRHELTAPIARVAAAHYKNAAPPLRFSYFNNVYRYAEPHDGRTREFYQAGVELIGVKNPQADAEVISMLSASLLELGIEEFQINLGHAGFFRGLLAELRLNDLDVLARKAILAAIHHKDAVLLDELLRETGLSAEQSAKLKAVTELYGGRETIGRARELIANATSRGALTELGEIIEILARRGVDRHIIIDLGEVRGVEYYSGMIFEVFVPALGSPLGSGGRYDNLLAEFGFPSPAVGFALELGRLLIVLDKVGSLPDSPTFDYLVVDSADSELGTKVTGLLRSKGYTVIQEVLERAEKASKRYASGLGVKTLLEIKDNQIHLFDLKDNVGRVTSIKELERL